MRPSDGKAPREVAFVQCAGSRDENHLPYCSAVCCAASLKQATYVRVASTPTPKSPSSTSTSGPPGRLEDFYAKVAADPNIELIKGKVAKVEEDAATEGPARRRRGRACTASKIAPSASTCWCWPPASCPQTAGLPAGFTLDEFGFVAHRQDGVLRRGLRRAGRRRCRPPSQDATGAALKALVRGEECPPWIRNSASTSAAAAASARRSTPRSWPRSPRSEYKVPLCQVHPFLCGAEGVGLIRKDLADGAVNTRGHCRLFAAREDRRLRLRSAGWSSSGSTSASTWPGARSRRTKTPQMMAEDYLRMGIAKAQKCEPLEPVSETISQEAPGGGRRRDRHDRGSRSRGRPATKWCWSRSSRSWAASWRTLKKPVPDASRPTRTPGDRSGRARSRP